MSDKDLLAAIGRGDADAAKAALDAGAKAGGAAPNGERLLVLAADSGNEAIVELLLARGAETDAAGETGNSALMHAAARGHIGVARLLLARGANPLHKNRWGKGPGDWAKWPANGPDIQTAIQDVPKR